MSEPTFDDARRAFVAVLVRMRGEAHADPELHDLDFALLECIDDLYRVVDGVIGDRNDAGDLVYQLSLHFGRIAATGQRGREYAKRLCTLGRVMAPGLDVPGLADDLLG